MPYVPAPLPANSCGHVRMLTVPWVAVSALV